jgi:predicted cation transporter
MSSELIIIGLFILMGLVLVLPFLSKRVEEELELFLFIMGIVSVSISGLWTKHIVYEAILEPIEISLTVLLAGLLFRFLRIRIKHWTQAVITRLGHGPFIFILVTGLGLVSSLITAIIAAVILAEIITFLKYDRKYEIRLVIIACYAIGLGAVLTPLGEPLATIAVSKLKGAPHYVDFFYLFYLLGLWVIPAIVGLGFWAAFLKPDMTKTRNTLTEDRPESYKSILFRALKVYLFVMALLLLGTGLTPLVNKYLIHIKPGFIYWVNLVSAVLDNATLTAAEISPLMSRETIRYLLLGLLVSGGMLIPGNIPNIICACKLSIKSKEWAAYGLPLGAIIFLGYFLLLNFVR